MTKILIILIVALVLEAVGVVLLSKGLKEVDARVVRAVDAGQVGTGFFSKAAFSFQTGLRNWQVVLGVVFEASFFGALMYLLSQRDVSVVWPLTSLGFVITTLAAKFYLKEEVPGLRWLGVALIILGAALITWTEKKAGTMDKPAVASAEPRL